MESIQAVAKLTDLTVSTLRYYDQLGLLPNLTRNQNATASFRSAM
ncbi:MerR family DNA-binding transcriptional regulator [Secundilactobacillus silagei]|nr:MerR family DNA-binding transcriptional regulator [Secundilactobacillus silagei]